MHERARAQEAFGICTQGTTGARSGLTGATPIEGARATPGRRAVLSHLPNGWQQVWISTTAVERLARREHRDGGAHRISTRPHKQIALLHPRDAR